MLRKTLLFILLLLQGRPENDLLGQFVTLCAIIQNKQTKHQMKSFINVTSYSIESNFFQNDQELK